jgi:hypothetical protein
MIDEDNREVDPLIRGVVLEALAETRPSEKNGS